MKSSDENSRLLSIPGIRDKSYFLAPAILLVTAIVVLPLDFAVAQWAVRGDCPGFFRDLLEAAETFGDGNGVIYIALAVVALDTLRRRTALRILATAYGAGLAADVVKLLVERDRPRAFAFDGTIWDSFAGFLPLTSAGSAGQSFPSAHTATAVGLAAALAWRYPRGRVFFFGMAVLVAAQRVASGAHYLSDTCCGAAVACLVAPLILDRGRLAAWFDRYEAGAAQPETLPAEPARPLPTRRAA